MRLVYKLYGDNQDTLIQTDDNGQNPRVLIGSPPPRTAINRVPAYIEVSCDDRAEIFDRVRNALAEIQKRVPAASN